MSCFHKTKYEIWYAAALHVRTFGSSQKKIVPLKLFILWRSISVQNLMVPPWLVQVLHPPHKFKRPIFWNCSSHLQWHDLRTKFHKNLLIVSKVTTGTLTYRKTELWFNKLYFPFQRNWAKNRTLVTVSKRLNESADSTFPLLCANQTGGNSSWRKISFANKHPALIETPHHDWQEQITPET
jgi:hypothetical protein